MQLIPGGDFWQDNIGRRYANAKSLSDPPGGACFRYASKWLLCKLYAKPFKNYDAALTGRDLSENFSDTKGFDKQDQYLKSVAPYEKPKTAYADFLAGVRAESRSYLEMWGNKNAKSGGVKYAISVRDRECRGLGEVAGLLGGDSSLVIGIFGANRKHLKAHGRAVMEDENWAHAFGYYRRGNDKRFFDSNGGEFDLGADNPVNAIEQYSTKFYAGFWKNYAWRDTEVNLGTSIQPKIVTQWERDLSQPPTNVMYANGVKTIYHYVLFEVTRK
jgi:hypothetical protein